MERESGKTDTGPLNDLDRARMRLLMSGRPRIENTLIGVPVVPVVQRMLGVVSRVLRQKSCRGFSDSGVV